MCHRLNELCYDSAHRTRTLRGLITQIQRDYAALNHLFDQIDHGGPDASVLEEIEKRVSWIRLGLRHLNSIGKHNIEGIFWVGLDRIEKDIERIETVITLTCQGYISKARDHYF